MAAKRMDEGGEAVINNSKAQNCIFFFFYNHQYLTTFQTYAITLTHPCGAHTHTEAHKCDDVHCERFATK